MIVQKEHRNWKIEAIWIFNKTIQGFSYLVCDFFTIKDWTTFTEENSFIFVLFYNLKIFIYIFKTTIRLSTFRKTTIFI